MSDINSSLPIRTELPGDVIVKVADSAIPSQQLKVNANGSVDANILNTDLDIRDLSHTTDSVKIGDGTDTLAINADGSINVIPQAEPGTRRTGFLETSLAQNASDNHEVTVTTGGKLLQVMGSASGKMKIEVQVETAAGSNVFNTAMVGFNSTANPNIDLQLAHYIPVAVGAKVRVIRTNKDNQTQSVYSSIMTLEN
jgi:hypothetical protein